MDAAASLNPLATTRLHYPVPRARTSVSVSGGDGRATGEASAAKNPTPARHTSPLAGQSDRERVGSHSSPGQLRREGYSHGAQVALRSYYATAHADVEIHRVDTYA